MRLTLTGQYRSLTDSPISEELADFVVLTGPNGSGKSNLLEAIAQGAVRIEDLNIADNERHKEIRHFPLGQLLVEAGGRQAGQIQESWYNIHNFLAQIRNEYDQQVASNQLPPSGAEQKSQWIRSRLISGYGQSDSVINELESRAGKSISEFTQTDLRESASILMGLGFFSISIADLFLLYHQRALANRLSQIQLEDGEDPETTPLSKEEFEAKNGPPPWTLLNTVLAEIGMLYEFDRPRGTELNISYTPTLTKKTGQKIQVDQLSSGERVLLAIAMSLYTGTHSKRSVMQMPKILLLDEPDASLHPSMIQSLLKVVRETFVVNHSVKVILTTHSPTTVALAPSDSLFVMRKDGLPRIRKVRRDEAMSDLLVGVPTLSISSDDRRQVFVEADDDADCYQALFTKMRPSLETPLTLTFIPSGAIGDSNRHKVTAMVQQLRDNGVDMLGVVDRDDRPHEVTAGVTISSVDRYSLENLILDPVAVGILLVRENLASALEVFGQQIPYFDFNNEHSQSACSYFVEKIRPQMPSILRTNIDNGDSVDLTYEGGGSVTVPKFIVNHKGHDLEEWIIAAYPGLNKFQGKLKRAVVTHIFSDLPQWIPTDFRVLFTSLLARPRMVPDGT